MVPCTTGHTSTEPAHLPFQQEGLEQFSNFHADSAATSMYLPRTRRPAQKGSLQPASSSGKAEPKIGHDRCATGGSMLVTGLKTAAPSAVSFANQGSSPIGRRLHAPRGPRPTYLQAVFMFAEPLVELHGEPLPEPSSEVHSPALSQSEYSMEVWRQNLCRSQSPLASETRPSSPVLTQLRSQSCSQSLPSKCMGSLQVRRPQSAQACMSRSSAGSQTSSIRPKPRLQSASPAVPRVCPGETLELDEAFAFWKGFPVHEEAQKAEEDADEAVVFVDFNGIRWSSKVNPAASNRRPASATAVSTTDRVANVPRQLPLKCHEVANLFETFDETKKLHERRWLEQDHSYMMLRTEELRRGTRMEKRNERDACDEDLYAKRTFHGPYSLQLLELRQGGGQRSRRRHAAATVSLFAIEVKDRSAAWHVQQLQKELLKASGPEFDKRPKWAGSHELQDELRLGMFSGT